jgi:hypothetical protein
LPLTFILYLKLRINYDFKVKNWKIVTNFKEELEMIESEETQIQELEAKEPSAEAIEGELQKLQNEAPIQEDESLDMGKTEIENAHEVADKGVAKGSASSIKIDELKKELETSQEPEARLAKTIEIMETSLAQTGNPDFKAFWESRKNCLELFKENIAPAVKALHWTKYRELTKEAKRLKEIFEEQTAFAIEQIEMAIKALENDISEFAAQIEKMEYPNLPSGIRALKNNLNVYLEKQRELNLLNAQAARINALRKELIRTEMRVRQKNKFFQRLSTAGDHVFPRRKELIKEISELFIADISEYIRTHFTGLENEKSLHPLREEIKALQAVAKMMTLNTNAFTQTRLKLSECWDKVKVVEKERKVEQAQQKQAFRENADLVRTKIKEFSDAVATNQLSSNEAQKKFDELNKFMRATELGRDEVKTLRDDINQAYKPLKAKMLTEEKKRRDLELENEQNRQIKIKEIEDRTAKLDDEIESSKIAESLKEIESIDLEINKLDLTEFEKDSLLRLLVPIRDALANKEIEETIALPNQNTEKNTQLKNALKTVSNQRNQIKEQIEKYRKASGGSGLDFEQSMYFNEQLNIEKLRYEKYNSTIEKLEAELAKYKKK